MKIYFFKGLVLSLMISVCFASCQDMMETESSLLSYPDEHELNTSADTVYSVIGIMNKIQALADRSVLLGELRADLVDLNENTISSLREIANFEISEDNPYNDPKDYYAVINNCNYFLQKLDTALRKRNEPIFIREFAAVKSFRAWTYLQLVLNYGQVPFYTEAILSEADAARDFPEYNIEEVCSYFIEDLLPYVDVELPGYGSIADLDSRLFYIPIRLLLGDLCLWSQRYSEAAAHYHEYLNENELYTGTYRIEFTEDDLQFEGRILSNSYGGMFSNLSSGSDVISIIPMDSSVSSNAYSQLRNYFNSTINNELKFQLLPSKRIQEISASQIFCRAKQNGSPSYAPLANEVNPLLAGDLRLNAYWSKMMAEGKEIQTIMKFTTDHVFTYRKGLIYLRYAEALNRAGYPESAFTILKYGLNNNNLTRFVSPREYQSGSGINPLLAFNPTLFTNTNTLGIHSRGSGDSEYNEFYVLPTPTDSLESWQDTLDYRIEKVEELILTEMALETALEGHRYYDLMRVALRRGQEAYLAEKVALRKGSSNRDDVLYNRLLTKNNWYLKMK